MAEDGKFAGAANGCLVVLGYLTVGLLPLALATGVALGAAMVVFGTERVTFLLAHLGSVAISTQQEWLIFTPIGLLWLYLHCTLLSGIILWRHRSLLSASWAGFLFASPRMKSFCLSLTGYA